METSDLMRQFMQKHDRIFPETNGKVRSGMKIRDILDESCEILDQTVGDLTRPNRAMPHLGNSDRETKPLQVD